MIVILEQREKIESKDKKRATKMKPHCILISLFLKCNILFKLLLLTFVLDIKIFNIFYFRLTMRGSHGLPLFIPIEMF